MEGVAEGRAERPSPFRLGGERRRSPRPQDAPQSSSVQTLQPRKQEILNKNPVSRLAFPCIFSVYKSTCMCLAKHLIKWSWVVIFTQLMLLYRQLLSPVRRSCLLFLRACAFTTTPCSQEGSKVIWKWPVFQNLGKNYLLSREPELFSRLQRVQTALESQPVYNLLYFILYLNAVYMISLTWSLAEEHFTIRYLPAQMTIASGALSNYCFE